MVPLRQENAHNQRVVLPNPRLARQLRRTTVLSIVQENVTDTDWAHNVVPICGATLDMAVRKSVSFLNYLHRKAN